MGVIMGIIWFVTGMHWAFALGYLIMAIVADFVACAGQYKSKKLNSLSYILFSLGGTRSYIVFFADPNGWAQTMLGNGTEQSYIDTMQEMCIRDRVMGQEQLQLFNIFIQNRFYIPGAPFIQGPVSYTHLFSSMCTTADTIFSRPTRPIKNSAALWENACISFGDFLLKNTGLAVMSVSTNRVLSFRVRHPDCSIRL